MYTQLDACSPSQLVGMTLYHVTFISVFNFGCIFGVTEELLERMHATEGAHGKERRLGGIQLRVDSIHGLNGLIVCIGLQ